jgi:hypothetical protein
MPYQQQRPQKQQHTCTNGKKHKSGGSKLYQLLIEVQNTIKMWHMGHVKLLHLSKEKYWLCGTD